MSEEQTVTYELEGEIALVGLNRPDKRNCFNPTVTRQLREAIDRAGEEAKCGIIFGHGDNFCAGLDLRWAAESWKTGRSERLPFPFNRNTFFEAMARGNIPFIAAHSSPRNAVDTLYNLALLALSSELLGAMEMAQEITLDYLRIRKQFGKLIGSFQALQHQAVNVYIRIEAARSLVYQVAANNDADRIDPAMAAAVKAKVSEDAMVVTKACIQLHGAIGFTDEHDIGLYLKRAMLLSSLLGNAAAQRRRYATAADLTA